MVVVLAMGAGLKACSGDENKKQKALLRKL